MSKGSSGRNRSRNPPARKQARRTNTRLNTDAFGMTKDAPRTLWNGFEGGPKFSPVTGLVQNSFVPAFNRLSFDGRIRYGAASINMTATTGQVGTYVYTANGLFDPSISGGTLQPAGFNQLMLSYDHYIVYKSRASITFTNNTTTPVCVTLRLHSDSTGTTDPSNLLEASQEQITVLDPSTTYGSTRTLVMDCDVSVMNGLRRGTIFSDPLFRGDVLSNPQEQTYFHACCFGVKGGSADVFMNVVIDYWARFVEPRELSPSLTKTLIGVVRRDAAQEKSCSEAKTAQDNLTSLGQFVRV
jgi:hypothetical protein